MRIETIQEAGSQKWGIMVDSMLDTDSLGYATEQGAASYAWSHYPGVPVITTDNPAHYSNR